MATTPPLRARAAAAKNGDPGTDVAARTNGGVARPETNLYELIDRMRPEIQRALPKHMDADRIARIATTVLRGSPELSLCTAESFLGAIMTASQLGLEPGPLGEAYLLPFGKVCTFVAGYRGLIKLAYQSGQIASIAAETVFEADTFAVHYGSERRIVHARPPLGTARGTALGWYALAKFKDGAEAFVVLDRPEVDAIRARSRAGKSGPWVTDYNAMAKKSCVRQLAKWLPLSPELTSALSHDGTARHFTSKEDIDAPGPYLEGEVLPEDVPPPGVNPATGEITDAPAAARATETQLDEIRAGLDARGMPETARRAFVEAELGRTVDDPAALTATEADQLIDALAQPGTDEIPF